MWWGVGEFGTGNVGSQTKPYGMSKKLEDRKKELTEIFGITKTTGWKELYSGCSDHPRINVYAAAKSEGIIEYI